MWAGVNARVNVHVHVRVYKRLKCGKLGTLGVTKSRLTAHTPASHRGRRPHNQHHSVRGDEVASPGGVTISCLIRPCGWSGRLVVLLTRWTRRATIVAFLIEDGVSKVLFSLYLLRGEDQALNAHKISTKNQNVLVYCWDFWVLFTCNSLLSGDTTNIF